MLAQSDYDAEFRSIRLSACNYYNYNFEYRTGNYMVAVMP